VGVSEKQGALPELTPLLCRGDKRYASEIANVELAPGVDGTCAHYVYVVTDDDGPDKSYPFEVVLTSIPESIGFAPRVLCHWRKGPLAGASDELSDALGALFGRDDDTSALPDRSVRLESEALEERYELKVDHDLGENWVRQLFSPSFAAWLADRAPEGMGFELIDGALCVYMPGKVDEAGRAAVVRAAAEVAGRIRNEALEEAGMSSAGAAAQPDRPTESLDAFVAHEVAEVRWEAPPKDCGTAIKAYRRVAMRTWRPWVFGVLTLLGLLGFGLAGVIWGGDGDAGWAILAAPFAAAGVWGTYVGDRARRFGKAAFAQEYAKSRGLWPEQPRLFQARNMQLGIPGVVESAMTGALPGADLEGTLALSATGVRKSQSRTDYNVLVTSIPAGVSSVGEIGNEGKDLGDGLHAVAHRGTLAVYAKSAGEKQRSLEELDRFCAQAGEALRALRAS
jgi:hypothetical protein